MTTSDTPPATLSETERGALFSGWLKPLTPAKPHRETLVARISPWRHYFADAIAAGFTWEQLAKEIATKPEIGIIVTAVHLKKCVSDAFIAAGESMNRGVKRRHRRRVRSESKAATAKDAGVTKQSATAAEA